MPRTPRKEKEVTRRNYNPCGQASPSPSASQSPSPRRSERRSRSLLTGVFVTYHKRQHGHRKVLVPGKVSAPTSTTMYIQGIQAKTGGPKLKSQPQPFSFLERAPPKTL
eukprot:EG_transcript_26488